MCLSYFPWKLWPYSIIEFVTFWPYFTSLLWHYWQFYVKSLISPSQEMHVRDIRKTEPFAFTWKILLETELFFCYLKQRNRDRWLNIEVLIRMNKKEEERCLRRIRKWQLGFTLGDLDLSSYTFQCSLSLKCMRF